MSLEHSWAVKHLRRVGETHPKRVDAAMRRLLQSDDELRWSLVLNAYLDQDINLGKAAELLGRHELELRDQLTELGIPVRVGPRDIDEARAESDALAKWLT